MYNFRPDSSDEESDDEDDTEETGQPCEVSKLSMDAWKKRLLPPDQPRTIIRAYYSSVPPAESCDEHISPSLSSRSKCPQRVVIESHILGNELEEISKLGFPNFPVM